MFTLQDRNQFPHPLLSRHFGEVGATEAEDAKQHVPERSGAGQTVTAAGPATVELQFAEDLTRGFLRWQFHHVRGTEVDAAEDIPERFRAGQPVPFPRGLMLSRRLAVSGPGSRQSYLAC
jgi:hypothetical protein